MNVKDTVDTPVSEVAPVTDNSFKDNDKGLRGKEGSLENLMPEVQQDDEARVPEFEGDISKKGTASSSSRPSPAPAQTSARSTAGARQMPELNNDATLEIEVDRMSGDQLFSGPVSASETVGALLARLTLEYRHDVKHVLVHPEHGVLAEGAPLGDQIQPPGAILTVVTQEPFKVAFAPSLANVIAVLDLATNKVETVELPGSATGDSKFDGATAFTF